MKKISSIFILICLVIFTLHAQTFVSTTPSNKNVIFEEFTGKNCGYCPDGHRIANQIAENNPDRVAIITIHTGPLSPPTPPNYNTPFGAAIEDQAGPHGYPSATVNRHVFNGTTTILTNKQQWNNPVNMILAQSSYVNIAAQSTIDLTTRELTVNVEIYYTGNSPVPTNKLNIALLQSNILGPQAGMESNPAQIVGNQYNHQHVLRHLLTGQWGENITPTTQNSFISKQYTYTIPAHLNDIDYSLMDLDVVVFIAESQQEIITGAKSSMTYPDPVPFIQSSTEVETYQCDNVRMEHVIKNMWDEQAVTSLEIEYTYNGATYSHEWEGLIEAKQSVSILSPYISVTSDVALPVTVRLANINGDMISYGNTSTLTFRKISYEITSNPVIFKFVTDQFASESSFKFFNNNGDSLSSGGPWDDLSSLGTTTRIFELNFTDEHCYKLEVYDKYGDGVNSGSGSGYLELLDTAGNRIAYNNGRFGYQANFYFNYVNDTLSGIHDVKNMEFKIYPNPVNSILHIESTDILIEAIIIYNIQGQKLLQIAFPDKNVNISALTKGIYVLQICTNKGITTQKFIKQ